MKKQKKQKTKKLRIRFYNVIDKVHQLGYDLLISRYLFIQGISIFSFFILGLIMKLKFPWILTMPILSIYFTPIVIYNQYRNRYETDRFANVNLYIEQMLFAFKNSHKILNAMQDILEVFPKGNEMRTLIEKAINIISNPNAVRPDENAEEKALQLIENHYHNDNIKSLHRFLFKVESVGGECDNQIYLLSENREQWENRTLALITKRRTEKGKILGSCIMSLLICIGTGLYILPQEVKVSNMLPVIIANILLVFLLGKIYLRGVKKLSADLLIRKSKKDAEQLQKDYFRFINYEPKKEFKHSLFYALLPLALALVNILRWKITALYFVAAILLIFMLCQHMIGHHLLERRLKKEISIAFPQWLLELTLLLQSENVQVAIFKTIPHALPILKPELEKLQKNLTIDPSSPQPYFEFFKDFHLSEVTTSMQMIYALSLGIGEQDVQISNIIKRNNKILDRTETKANDDSLAGLYTLFLLPMLLGSINMIICMSLFLMNYITKLTI